MSTTREEICDELEVDLCLARLEFVAARARLTGEGTAANRAAVAAVRARLDVILDLLVELTGGAPAVSGRRFEWDASVAVRPPDQSLLEPPGRPRRR